MNSMYVEIEVTDDRYNDIIINCFTKRKIKYHSNLIFIETGHVDDFANMFLSIIELLNCDFIYPILKKVDFIERDGNIEDVLTLLCKNSPTSKVVR